LVIEGEGGVTLHVRNCEPHTVQWNLVGLESVDGSLDGVDALSWDGAVEAHGPEWWKSRFAQIVVIFSKDGLGITAEEEVDVQVSTDCNIAQESFAAIQMSSDWRLGVGASEEHTEELIRVRVVVGLDQTEGMYAR